LTKNEMPPFNNKELLSFANTEGGRYLLASLGDGKIEDYPIVKITPNSFHQQVEPNLWIATFYTDDFVLRKLLEPLTKMEAADEWGYGAFLHHAGLEFSPKYSHVFLASLETFNPQAGDGWVRAFDDTSFTTARNKTTGDDLNYTDGYFYVRVFWSTEPQKYIYRGFFPFNTSSLPDGVTILQTDTKFQIYPQGVEDANSMSLGLVQTTQASTETLALDDYSNLTLNNPDEGSSRVTLASLSTLAYNDFDANANLVSWISKTGNTLLGLRMSADIDDSGYPTAEGQDNRVYANSGENASGKPRLVVAYGIDYTKDLTDSFVMVDSVTKDVSKELLGAIAPVDTFSRTWSLSRVFSETMFLVDNLGKGRLKALIDNLSLSDNIWSKRVRAAVSWLKKTITSSTWTQDSPTSTSWTQKRGRGD